MCGYTGAPCANCQVHTCPHLEHIFAIVSSGVCLWNAGVRPLTHCIVEVDSERFAGVEVELKKE